MAVAGRVLIIPKGDYDGTTSYRPLDLVSHNGAAWLCKKNCVAIEPSATSSEYWFKMSISALANNLVTDEEGYALDARQGKTIKELIDSLSADQSVIATTVTNLTATVNGLMGTNIASVYDSTKTYNVGDYVTYNNGLYVCTVKISSAEAFNSSHWKHCYIMEEINDKVTEIVEDIVNSTVNTEIGNLTAGAGLYSECTTAAATTAKVVTISGFTLKTGARVTVNFQYANTASAPTLNVSSTGAKAIKYRSSSSVYSTYKDIPMGPVTLAYNGSYWVAEGGKVDGFTSGNYAPVMGLAYDATNKKIGLKVLGADSVIGFLGGFENCEIVYSGFNRDSGETISGSATKTEGILVGLTNSYYSKSVAATGNYSEIATYGSTDNGNTLYSKAVKCNGSATMTVTGMSGSSRGPATVIILWIH